MSQLDTIQAAQVNLEETFTKRMAELETQLQVGAPAKDTVAKVAEEFRTFRELMFSMLRLIRQQISECSRTVDLLETRHRKKALIFMGIAEAEKEDCTAVILDIIHSNMSLKEISAPSISVCHRLGTPNNNHSRPILVRFSSLDIRSLIWRTKSKLKGSIASIKEFLTKPRQTVFNKARQHFGMRSCWTQDGIIVVKAPDGTRHKFFTMDDLNQLIIKYPRAVGESSCTGNSTTITGNIKSRRNI